MTLEEAIAHSLEVAEQNEAEADWIDRRLIGSTTDKYATDCRECAADHRQLAAWLTELKEAKRLLKAAVEDMKDVVSSDSGCRCCKGEEAASCAYIKCWTWRYADEALALIGGEEQ